MTTIKCVLLFTLCMALLCLLGCKSKEGSSGEIHGIVTDAETSQPLVDASVILDSDTIITAGDGSYLIKDLQPGDYQIQALKTGYMKKTINANVSLEKTSEVNINLNGSANISTMSLDFGAELTIRYLILSKTGKTVLKYSASTNSGWIEVSPASGELTDKKPDTLKVMISKQALGLDIQKGEIVINTSIDQETQQDKIGVYVNGVLDRDLTYYKIVKIGGQYWMAENTHAGTIVASGAEQNDPQTIKKYSYDSEYGGLYTFSGMMRGGAADNKTVGTTQGVCPVGWHIPTQDEWSELINYLGEPVSGVKLKQAGESHWQKGNVATNESGFTALPGGMWDGYNFGLLHSHALFWTASSDQSAHYYAIQFEYNAEKGRFLPFQTKEAFSVRCVKNP
jgi:uncharacterized protein (TIGR02145 family)